MSRIMEAWEDLLREAIASDYDDQQNALFQIGLILQRHNPYITPDSDVYEESLSRELLRLTLNEDRQRDTVTYLIQLVRNHPQQAAGFLFALSNAQPKILVEPLLALLQDVGVKMRGDAVYQALLALEYILRYGGEDVEQALLAYDIAPVLDAWTERSDDIIVDKAEQLADRISALRGE